MQICTEYSDLVIPASEFLDTKCTMSLSHISQHSFRPNAKNMQCCIKLGYGNMFVAYFILESKLHSPNFRNLRGIVITLNTGLHNDWTGTDCWVISVCYGPSCLLGMAWCGLSVYDFVICVSVCVICYCSMCSPVFQAAWQLWGEGEPGAGFTGHVWRVPGDVFLSCQLRGRHHYIHEGTCVCVWGGGVECV